MAHVDSSLSPKEQRTKNIKKIWMVAGILALVTAIEYVIAFAIDPSIYRNVVFILLTLVKAGYIVAEFMHLKHEAKYLIFAILVPIIFVCWFMLAMLIEGTTIFGIRFPELVM
ncbi:putative small integral membrane protein [Bernardetia litoralis DSM 6794]|uniref:Putative small integral membrane protein n=1 Tax=Bernardetia litoralis (strain ATCC 23117 / DSM 6794 / NBRC 15988 / NCIMB 1366 / Fx l1 / Sio-4) TaxID=880071 RepID=I4AHR6_BERLS|nr:cytochrome C oxidase subunit IV family protein [Bernardetia litoralis]AFM03501.1 putative small integral membrane protein [Bernardetia litoralis DSM 6794]